MIPSTLDNPYKFIGMEGDFEGTAVLEHTLHRQYAPSLGRWLTPHPLHGTAANPRSWTATPTL